MREYGITMARACNIAMACTCTRTILYACTITVFLVCNMAIIPACSNTIWNACIIAKMHVSAMVRALACDLARIREPTLIMMHCVSMCTSAATPPRPQNVASPERRTWIDACARACINERAYVCASVVVSSRAYVCTCERAHVYCMCADTRGRLVYICICIHIDIYIYINIPNQRVCVYVCAHASY